MAVDLVIRAKVEGNAKQELNELKNAGEQTSRSTDRLASSFSSLSGILAGVGFAVLAKQAIGLADTYKLMEARLSLVSKNTNELVSSQSKLFQISQDTRVSLEATSNLYTKMSMATQSLGKSQAQVLAVTKSVNEAMKISGATTEEATSTVLQLGQALASGTLAGDEYKSLRENAPRLAKAIADGMGVQVGALKNLSAEGKLTAEVVFDAIEKSGVKLEDEFKRIPATVGDSFTQVGNSLMKVVGDMDGATGATASLSSAIQDMAQYLDRNTDAFVNFGKFAYATIDRTIDMFKLLGAFVTNTIEYALGQMSSLVWGAVSGIAEANLWATKMLHEIGLSSDATYKTAKDFSASASKNYNLSRQSVKQDIDDLDKAISDASDTVEDRMKKMVKIRKEFQNDTSGGGAMAHTETADEKKARLAREKLAEAEAKIQRGYIEGYADLEAQKALEEYNTKLGYEEAYRDIQAKNAIDQYNEEVSNLNAWADLEAQTAIKKFEDENKFWDGLFSNVNQAMDNQFFDAMTGKFKSFGSWLKDFWSSITQSMSRGLSKSLADSILGTGNNSSGGLVNMFKSFGGLGAVGGSGNSIASIVGGSTDSMGITTTAGGTVLDVAGNITSQGSDYSSVLSQLSNGNSLYNLASNGITSTLYAPSAFMGNLAGTAYGYGFTGTGSFLGGSANVLAGGGVQGLSGSAWAGGVGTAGLMGGVGGYALGSAGDKLFGANTKAGSYGAIGGAVGAIAGSIVPVIGTLVGGAVGAVLGSVIGGAFGKTTKKLKDSGVQAYGTQSASGVDLDTYQTIKTTKKSWFKSSSKTKTKYTDMNSKDQNAIQSLFETYDYLLGQLGSLNETFVAAGKYTKNTFMDAVNKSFISAFVDDKSLTDTFYASWTEYAKGINKSVGETFAQVIGGYVSNTRSFKEWSLGSGSVDQLKFTSDYLNTDFKALESQMGVSGVTVDNYLSMYDNAIKKSFTPETINSWKSLGDALMSATNANNAYVDANDKYIDSLKVTTALIPQDMMLGKTSDGSSIFQQLVNDNTTMKLMYADMLRTMKSMLTIQQFGVVVV